MDCTQCGAPLPAKTIRCPFCRTLDDPTSQKGSSSSWFDGICDLLDVLDVFDVFDVL